MRPPEDARNEPPNTPWTHPLKLSLILRNNFDLCNPISFSPLNDWNDNERNRFLSGWTSNLLYVWTVRKNWTPSNLYLSINFTGRKRFHFVQLTCVTCQILLFLLYVYKRKQLRFYVTCVFPRLCVFLLNPLLRYKKWGTWETFTVGNTTSYVEDTISRLRNRNHTVVFVN